MKVGNMSQGEACGALDYNEYEAWVKLEIRNPYEA